MSESITLEIGLTRWTVRVPAERQLSIQRKRLPSPAESPEALLETALENPVGLNAPLRRALTPDDRVTIVVDEQLPNVGILLRGFLGHLTTAHIDPRNVTLLVAKPGAQSWLEDLPDEYGDVKVEVHVADDRDKLAYLATTKAGRRVYLNRTLVDADVVAVLSARRFDPTFGYSGAEVAIFPTLADEESQAASAAEFQKGLPKEKRAMARAESLEILKLLGSTFLLQAIEGLGDTITAVVVGLGESTKAGVELLREYWSGTVNTEADLVIAAISGSSDRIAFSDLAKAAVAGKRVLASKGRLVILTDSAPVLDEAAELLRKAGTPASAHKRIALAKPVDPAAANLWVLAANNAHLFVKSGWPDELVEELFATPLHSVTELQRLIDAAEHVLVLPDAHKTRVKVIDSEETTE
jgi:nickel-dependent lactate racemase